MIKHTKHISEDSTEKFLRLEQDIEKNLKPLE